MREGQRRKSEWEDQLQNCTAFQRDLSSLTSSAERKREELGVLCYKQLPLQDNDIKRMGALKEEKKRRAVLSTL